MFVRAWAFDEIRIEVHPSSSCARSGMGHTRRRTHAKERANGRPPVHASACPPQAPASALVLPSPSLAPGRPTFFQIFELDARHVPCFLPRHVSLGALYDRSQTLDRSVFYCCTCNHGWSHGERGAWPPAAVINAGRRLDDVPGWLLRMERSNEDERMTTTSASVGRFPSLPFPWANGGSSKLGRGGFQPS